MKRILRAPATSVVSDLPPKIVQMSHDEVGSQKHDIRNTVFLMCNLGQGESSPSILPRRLSADSWLDEKLGSAGSLHPLYYGALERQPFSRDPSTGS
jgi:hypothetical protein